jgi:hypothetical protein
MDNFGVGVPDAEWPNNLISRMAVVYGSGAIARRGSRVRHAVDPEELARCRRLAAEAASCMGGADVGMGSESSDPFREFFIAANADEPAPRQITPQLIRARFGDTLFPAATITVEPLAETGIWWSEVQRDGAESGPEYFLPWRRLIQWFRGQPEFADAAFVRVGDAGALEELPRDQYPAGTEFPGSALPRLALGLTRQGSLTGLFGFSVQT